MIEYTLSIIKPDATDRNNIGKIISYLENEQLKIVALKMIRIDEALAQQFYIEHAEKPFYKDLITFITSGPVVVQVLKGENAILKNRKIMGATNPADAEQGTIRKEFGISIDSNSIHGSDSKESAGREIALFFDDAELME